MRKDFKQLLEYAAKKRKIRELKEQKLADFILKRLALFFSKKSFLPPGVT